MNKIQTSLLATAAFVGIAVGSSVTAQADQTLYFGVQQAATKSQLMNGDKYELLYESPDSLNQQLQEMKAQHVPAGYFAVDSMNFTDSEIATLKKQGRLMDENGKPVTDVPATSTTEVKNTLPATGSVNESGLAIAGLATTAATLGFAARRKF